MAQSRRIHRIDSLYPGSDKFYTPYIGKGNIIFTGPDAIRNHNVTILKPTYVGIGTMSPEGTSNAEYLWRPGKRWAFPPPKSARVGAIGWGLQRAHDTKILKSGYQMKVGYGTFRQVCEDRHTHLYQNPWCPDMRYEEQGGDDLGNGWSLAYLNNGRYPDMRYEDQEGDGLGKGYKEHSRQRASPGAFRSQTPLPRNVHYDNGVRLTRRSKSCTPGSSQRTRSGTLSSTASSNMVRSQIYAL